MIVLRVHAMKLKVSFHLVSKLRLRVHLPNERTARAISVDNHFENVVVQIGVPEVPEVVVRFIKKVEMILALDPAYFDLHVKVLRITLVTMLPHSIHQLIRADGI